MHLLFNICKQTSYFIHYFIKCSLRSSTDMIFYLKQIVIVHKDSYDYEIKLLYKRVMDSIENNILQNIGGLCINDLSNIIKNNLGFFKNDTAMEIFNKIFIILHL